MINRSIGYCGSAHMRGDIKVTMLIIITAITIVLTLSARGQLLNGDFSDSTNHWNVVMPNGKTGVNGVIPFDIDGAGALGMSPAFYTSGSLLYLEQNVVLAADTSYRFGADIAMTSNDDYGSGGNISVFIDTTMIASISFGETYPIGPKYAQLSGNYKTLSSGVHTLSIHFSNVIPTNYIDNITLSPALPPLLINGDFSVSTNGWNVVMPRTNASPNGITIFDIDGSGPLRSSMAFYAQVGWDTPINIEQNVVLSSAVSYQFAANLAMYSMGNNNDGGTVSAFIDTSMIDSASFGSTTAKVNQYSQLVGTYKPLTSGIHTLSIHFTRNYAWGSSTPIDYIDNIALSPVLPSLSVQSKGTNIILTWTNSAFVLQAAPQATGIYTNIADATSPYTNTIIGSGRYFRLMAN